MGFVREEEGLRCPVFLKELTPGAEAAPYLDVCRLYETDRSAAIHAILAEICRGPGLREPVVVGFIEEQAWLIADLHHRNIMQDQEGRPTIIDALTGLVTPGAHQMLPWLANAVADET